MKRYNRTSYTDKDGSIGNNLGYYNRHRIVCMREERRRGNGGASSRGKASGKPSRKERGYTEARGPKGAAEWAKYFEGQVESQPFYENFKKKKKK